MKQNMGRLIRYFLTIRRLSGLQKYIPADDLVSYLNKHMRQRGYDEGISKRTLQRDFKEIEHLFSIVIMHRRDYGYFIESKDPDPDISYDQIIVDFDIITAINPETQELGFILPEHHRPKGSDSLPLFITAIKERRKLKFDYELYRKDNRIINKTISPYFLKESLGLWYLIGTDEDGTLKLFGIDRITDPELLTEKYAADKSIDPTNLFTHSFGIWDDPHLPVEHIELSYSPLDGSFIKAKPLHRTQKVLVDNDNEFRISLDIRITNDFVMELLSRSKSVEVIKPDTLRNQIAEIALQCYKRNS